MSSGAQRQVWGSLQKSLTVVQLYLVGVSWVPAVVLKGNFIHDNSVRPPIPFLDDPDFILFIK